jgi:hypothetical protein
MRNEERGKRETWERGRGRGKGKSTEQSRNKREESSTVTLGTHKRNRRENDTTTLSQRKQRACKTQQKCSNSTVTTKLTQPSPRSVTAGVGDTASKPATFTTCSQTAQPSPSTIATSKATNQGAGNKHMQPSNRSDRSARTQTPATKHKLNRAPVDCHHSATHTTTMPQATPLDTMTIHQQNKPGQQ